MEYFGIITFHQVFPTFYVNVFFDVHWFDSFVQNYLLKNLFMKKLSIFIVLVITLTGGQQLFAQSAWWRYAKLPDGGNITDIASDTLGTVYALSSLNTDIFYTTNNGLYWKKIAGTQYIWNGISISVDKPTGTLYVGTGNFGIEWTADKGATWGFEYIYTDPVTGYHALIPAIGVKNNNAVIIANNPGTGLSTNYISTDGGTTWNPHFAPYMQANKFKFIPSGTLYAGTVSGIYYSPDNGISWTPGTGANSKNITSLAYKISNGHLFAGANMDVFTNDSAGCGVFKSTNGGATWALSSAGITDRRISGVECDNSGNVYATTTTGIYRSTDDGNTWAPLNSGLETTNTTCIVSTPAGIFAGSARSGVCYAPVPVTAWTYKNKGLCPTSYFQMTMSHSGNIHVIDQSISGAYSLSGGNWTHMFNGLPEGQGRYIHDAGGIIYASMLFGSKKGIYKSVDLGSTWTNITPPIPDSTIFVDFTRVKADSAHHMIYVLAEYTAPALITNISQRLFSSGDGGTTWNTLLTAYDTSVLRYHDINLTTTGDLYVTASVFLTTEFIPLLSTDFGATFNPVAIDSSMSYSWSSYLTIDRNDSLYLVNDTRIFRRNGINNWDSLHNGGWTNSPLYVSFDNNNKIYLGTNYEGVFYSADDSTFTPFNTGIPTYTDIWGMAYPIGIFGFCFDNTNTPYAIAGPAAAIYNNLADTLQGIYTFSTPPPLAANQGEISNHGSIVCAYPNPSNSTVNVAVSLKNSGFIVAIICDVSGKFVKRIPTGNCKAGVNNFSLDLQDIVPGIYYLHLNTSEGEQSVKLLRE
jgi:photosystem II stability/assembly factor-like uncharacterized protein